MPLSPPLRSALALLIPLAATAAQEPVGPRTGSLYLVWDNDVFIGDDDGYTNGLTLGWLSGAREDWGEIPGFGWIAPLGGRLPLMDRDDRLKALALELSHLMFTPEDIEADPPDPLDRPYAGVSHLTLNLQQFDQTRLDSWELLLGLIGDDAYAEELQIEVHEQLDVTEPKGWDHQIASSPLLNLGYEHRRRWLRVGEIDDGFGSDAILGIRGVVGNYRTALSAELVWRLGYHAHTGFGTVGSSPGSAGRLIPSGSDGSWGIHLNLGIGGEVVAHDITLDGRPFTDDDFAIDREPFVARAFAGLGGHLGRLQLHLQVTGSTRSFEQEDERPAYGRLLLGWSF